MKNTEKSSHLSGFRILIGLVVGIVAGAILKNSFDIETLKSLMANVTTPVGNIFLRSLFMVVVPLVLCSLAVGVAQLGSVEHLGRLGRKLALFYLSTTAIAVLIGQLLVTTIQPGQGVNASFVDSAKASFSEQTSNLISKSEGVKTSLWPGMVEKIVPKNIIEELAATNMLAIIFVGILIGVTLLKLQNAAAQTTIQVLQTISDSMIMIIGWVMQLAPFAVGCLMFNAVVQFDISIIGNVAQYFGVVVLGYIIHMCVTYSLITKFVVKLPLRYFFRNASPIFITAFSTSSSNATLPTTIGTLQKNFGVPERITTFCAPLGATINMDGTALFEIVAALFIAQVFGIHLSLADHLTLVVLVIVTSVGVAGVPGGSIPLLMSAMAAVGIPPEGIALILGVDRLLDMGRTVLNTTGDALASLYLSRVEQVPLEDFIPKAQNS
jgi:DAACS family dicarboxylate/amino acid:cation (Na+ or H+) symporter